MRQRRSFLALVFAREAVGAAVFFFILCLIAMPPSLWNMPALYRDAARLEQDGADAIANVMTLEKTAGDSPRHLVSYAFLLNGKWIEGQSRVSENVFDNLRLEDRVPIRYWTEDPTLAEIAPGMNAWEFRQALIIRGLALLLTLPFLLHGIWHAARVRWLVRNGTPMEAEVLELVSASKDDGPLAWKARWIGPDGRTGLTETIPASRTPPLGSGITILTDPAGWRGSIWEGDT
jgi:hypothetical protein